jgi:hypothetical protein
MLTNFNQGNGKRKPTETGRRWEKRRQVAEEGLIFLIQ